jgi:DNA repair and recombination protein RAD52
MTFTPETVAALSAPLDPKHVKKPTGNFGPKGDYLEGWHVINELNRIFGFDGWSYQIELTRDSLIEGVDSKQQPQWQAAYSCICTLTVGGVVRQDVGFGSGFAKGIGDAIEGATKEATTDALKRCARTFGNPFGLALYDKSRANVATPEKQRPKTITEEQQTLLIDLCSQTGVQIGAFLAVGNCSDIREVPAAEFENAKAWIMDRAAEKQKENA